MNAPETPSIAELVIKDHYARYKDAVSTLEIRFGWDQSKLIQEMHYLDHRARRFNDRNADRQAEIIEKNLANEAEAKKKVIDERDAALGAAAVHKDEHLDEYIQLAHQEMQAAEQLSDT